MLHGWNHTGSHISHWSDGASHAKVHDAILVNSVILYPSSGPNVKTYSLHSWHCHQLSLANAYLEQISEVVLIDKGVVKGHHLDILAS